MITEQVAKEMARQMNWLYVADGLCCHYKPKAMPGLDDPMVELIFQLATQVTEGEITYEEAIQKLKEAMEAPGIPSEEAFGTPTVGME